MAFGGLPAGVQGALSGGLSTYPGSVGSPGSPPVGPPINKPIIPDAGVYGAETAAATNAYNNAVAAATAQRNSLYNQYGLGNDGSVDPNNPYGQYQQMLNQQGRLFQADREDAAQRHLGSGGLANQAEGRDRQDAQAQDFQFQQQVASVASDYQNALANALSTEQGGISQAYNDALNTALQNMLASMASGNYTAPGTGTPPPAPSKAPAPKPHQGRPKPRHPGRQSQ